jgi:hypothetical protein
VASNSITHFCYISESCVPAVSLDAAIALIEQTNTTWIKWKPRPNNGYATQDQFTPLAQSIPMECIFKADQWVLLLRPHVEELLALIDSLNFDPFRPFQRVSELFLSSLLLSHVSLSVSVSLSLSLLTDLSFSIQVRASDEMFIPTCFSLLNYVSKVSTESSSSQGKQSIELSVMFDSTQFSCRRVTYCEWTTSNAKNPSTFPQICSSEAQERVRGPSSGGPYNVPERASEEGCLFMRKIMNSSIQYPSDQDKRRDHETASAQRVSEMWSSREEMLSVWCREVLQINLKTRNVLEEAEEGKQGEGDESTRIWEIVQSVQVEFQEDELQRVTKRSQERSREAHHSDRRSRSWERDRPRDRSRVRDRSHHRSRSRDRDHRSRDRVHRSRDEEYDKRNRRHGYR